MTTVADPGNLEFRPSDPDGIGVELEFQLLDGETLDLVDGILPLMQLLPDRRYVKPEFIQNTVEVASRVCYGMAELKSHLDTIVTGLRTHCLKLGMTLCGAGTHPFSQSMAILTPTPRYLQMEQVDGYLSHIQITFALHVHIGMRSATEAIRVMRDLIPYLPLLIALSASSPFWRGYATGHVSYRQRILAATRSYGIPPAFSDWDEFCRFFNTTCRAGIFETINDIHWDIRPRPQLGSLEIRVMDAQPTLRQSLLLAAFVRLLVYYLRTTGATQRPACLPGPLPWWIEKLNHYQASKLGLAAQYIGRENTPAGSLAQLFQEVGRVLEEPAAELGQTAYLEQLRSVVAGGLSHARQQTVYRQTGSLRGVVSSLITQLEHELSSE